MGPQLERFIKAVSRFVSPISEACEWWIDKQVKSYRMDIVSLLHCSHIPGSEVLISVAACSAGPRPSTLNQSTTTGVAQQPA